MKKNIAIVCGGDSGEYEISIKSAAVVKKHLSPEKWNTWLVLIKASGWYATLENGEKVPVDKNDFSIQDTQGRKIKFDAVFNAIHGTPGEDGKLLAYFDMLGIPYNSSGATCCALTFHKDFCKRIVASNGVHVADSILINKRDSIDSKEIIKQLGLPVFVKPNNGGSSVGVSKVKNDNELFPAIEKAFREDTQVLIESFVEGREIGCGVVEHKGRMLVFPLTEIISKNEFFDYEAKYTDGMSDEITPAAVDEAIELEIKATAALLYHRIECRGIARFDFILTKEEEIYFLEVNIVPGMSEASIIPKQAECMGISLQKLFDMTLDNLF
ncbi:MAG: D-alanine--D-alanine ligase [Lentimicrobiaceae bacterium]|jgi:D-alanine-D-alanine ligase|nr:D-alanine--D-alanine ligase [Lentimicrobiaceae bacterium]